MCQKLFLPDVETEELEVTGGAVSDADELPPDAITRRETHQVHAKEKQQQQQPKKSASQQTGNSTGHNGLSTERMRRSDMIVHAQLGVERQHGHFKLSAINYVQRY